MPGYKSKVAMSRSATVPRTQYIVIDRTIDGFSKLPEGYVTVDANTPVSLWIETYPLYMWKYDDIPAYTHLMTRYIISNELLTLMLLKWT